MGKLWINEHKFIELSDAPDNSRTREIALRSRSMDWTGNFFGYLPDPDPILQNLGAALSTYRQLLSDAHVWSCYDSRKSGTLCNEWQIKETGKSGKRQFDAISDIINRLDINQIITDMLDAPFFGMSPIEVIWKAEGGKWIPDRVEGKPADWFVFSDKNELRFLSLDHQTDGEEIPPMRILLPRHHASYLNPYGERTLARCFWPCAFKKGGFKFWAIFLEKFGMPWVVGKVPRSTNDTERDALLARLVSMVQDACAVINDDESIEMPEAQGKSASSDIYERMISACNREVSKAILGQTLSTELDKGGSLAATEGHLEVRGDIVDKDKKMVKAAFNLFFQWISILNFGSPDSPAELDFYEEEDVQKELAERDKTLTDQGVRFKPNYYQKAYNLDPEDFEVKEPATSTPGLGTPLFQESQNKAQDRFSQDGAGEITQGAARASQEAISGLLAPILKAVEGANSYAEIGEAIYKLYPNLDTARFQELLARAMTACAAVGYGGSADEGSEQ